MLNWKNAKATLQQKSQINLETILIVDDEEPNLRQLKAMLSSNYKVLTARNGIEALQHFTNPEITAIISDQRMPEMSGIELFMEAERRQNPATRLILTGFAELQNVVEAINKGKVFRYLTKPIVEEDLHQAVKQAVDHFKVTRKNLQLMSMIKNLIEDNAQMSKRLGKDYNVDISSNDKKSLFLTSPQKTNLVVMFTDIRGFTNLSNELTPEKVIEVLQVIYKNIHPFIYSVGGMVDKHMGDGLMAVFGLGGNSGILAGVKCMQNIVNAYSDLMPEIVAVAKEPLRLGIGLAAGEVVMGMLGSEARSELAIIGQTVNLASRLQDLTKLALLNPQEQERFGGFDHVMGICLPEMLNGLNGFRDVDLPEGRGIRGFWNIRKVSVISK